jgi:glyoxylase-like metal-dependent hydrolase (beta-lactamase superfamily II)
LREISFDKGPQILQIGKFLAYDYFNDGSLYLLDSPGHCVGHVCALARTTTSPETFVFLGGDVAHHCAEVRPSYYVPLPETITLDPRNSPLNNNNSVPFCPGAWFEDLQTSRGRDPKGSLFQPAFGHNMEEALESIEKVQHLDGEQNIFVILAHDTSLRSSKVNFYHYKINDWKSRGLGDLFRWTWIGDILNSLKGGKHDETR